MIHEPLNSYVSTFEVVILLYLILEKGTHPTDRNGSSHILSFPVFENTILPQNKLQILVPPLLQLSFFLNSEYLISAQMFLLKLKNKIFIRWQRLLSTNLNGHYRLKFINEIINCVDVLKSSRKHYHKGCWTCKKAYINRETAFYFCINFLV